MADQAIFGPRCDFACACGKYDGIAYERIICDRCGVKVGPSTLRRRRFGHINLRVPIRHALDDSTELDAIPVLPASYWESAGGLPLAYLYEDVVRGSSSAPPGTLITAVRGIAELLLPVATAAQAWDLADAPMVARGLALTENHEAVDPSPLE